MAKLLTEKYEINKTVGSGVNVGKVTIYVEIDSDDQVTIKNHKEQAQFVFTRSHKNVIRAMAQALQEAGELVESRKVTAG